MEKTTDLLQVTYKQSNLNNIFFCCKINIFNTMLKMIKKFLFGVIYNIFFLINNQLCLDKIVKVSIWE